MAGVAASALYVAGFPRESADGKQAERMSLHLAHPFLAELVVLGERMIALQRSRVGMAEAPFHALVAEALGECES